jgi:hypothetical protein
MSRHMNRAFALNCYHRAVRAVGALALIGTVAPAALAQELTPTVTYPMTSAVTKPLWSMPQSSGAPSGAPEERPLGRLPQRHTASSQARPADQALQTGAGAHLPVQNQTNFGGIVQDGYIPPDPNMAVGPTDIVQVVNSAIAVFDKNGNMRSGYPKGLSSLWSALGGACGRNNAGDPVVQYDRFADRWLITQLGSVRSPYSECFAVSNTGDPEGGYSVYSYSFGTSLNDYPKFGVWPTAKNSAYLGTYNMFANGSTFSGAKLCSYDREAMLSGAAAPVQVCFDISGDGGFLPSDVDGPTIPLDGTPGYFLTWETTSRLRLYKLSPDFTTPSNSTLSTFTDISVNSFSPACTTTTCAIVPQPGTSRQLDTLGDRLMNRLPYRIFGDHASMVANHSVYSGQGSGVGVRWYELRTNGSGGFSVYQQSTFAPDANYRWMGSIAMDGAGNMALGYSRSASTTGAGFNGYPSIYVAGRQSTDALNTMGAETVLQSGGGSQTGYTRWGDYTSLQIDPSDDCTFWYTNEYYPQTASYNWYTFIGSYKFSSCGSSASTGDFSVSETPSSIGVSAAATGSGTVTVTSLNNFSAPVGLTTTCPPSGSSNHPISCSLNPSSITPPVNSSANATLNVAVDACTTSGSSSFSVTGGSGSVTHSATFSVNVTGRVFSLSASPASLTIPRGSSDSTSITVTNPSGSISLSVAGLPPRTSASFSPNPVVCPSGSAILTIKTNKRTPKGIYPLTITGNNGVTSSPPTSVTLTVN